MNRFVSPPIPKILPNSSNHSLNLTTGERLCGVSSDDHNRLEKAFGRAEVSGSGIKKYRSLFRYWKYATLSGAVFHSDRHRDFDDIFSDHPFRSNPKYLFTIFS